MLVIHPAIGFYGSQLKQVYDRYNVITFEREGPLYHSNDFYNPNPIIPSSIQYVSVTFQSYEQLSQSDPDRYPLDYDDYQYVKQRVLGIQNKINEYNSLSEEERLKADIAGFTLRMKELDEGQQANIERLKAIAYSQPIPDDVQSGLSLVNTTVKTAYGVGSSIGLWAAGSTLASIVPVVGFISTVFSTFISIIKNEEWKEIQRKQFNEVVGFLREENVEIYQYKDYPKIYTDKLATLKKGKGITTPKTIGSTISDPVYISYAILLLLVLWVVYFVKSERGSTGVNIGFGVLISALGYWYYKNKN